jgi:hypothetical protein
LSAQTIGHISGGLVILSGIPYTVRVLQGKIRPVPSSWLLWTLIGLALLLSYKSSGAEENVWPAVFGFTNPVMITAAAIWRGGKWKKLESYEWACLVFGIGSLIMWWFVKQNHELSQWALVLAIAADIFAAIPTFIFFWHEPDGDRPIPWLLFAIGYFIAIFAIEEKTFANYVLPLYMTALALTLTTLLAIPRIKRRASIKEWI